VRQKKGAVTTNLLISKLFYIDPDSGVVRQMEHSIKAINDERLRRRARWPLAVSVLGTVIALISLGLSVWVLFRH
jgi:hypothetical protein